MSIVAAAVVLGVQAPRAQAPGYGQPPTAQALAMKRTVLLKEDLAMPGHEVVPAIVALPNGARSGRHTHPGEEVGSMLEGTIILAVEGKPQRTLKAGDTFFVEKARLHETINESGAPAKILATYMVEKVKPLATPASCDCARTRARVGTAGDLPGTEVIQADDRPES
jgi:quercetin dioxygenase-like cupin family protein